MSSRTRYRPDRALVSRPSHQEACDSETCRPISHLTDRRGVEIEPLGTNSPPTEPLGLMRADLLSLSMKISLHKVRYLALYILAVSDLHDCFACWQQSSQKLRLWVDMYEVHDPHTDKYQCPNRTTVARWFWNVSTSTPVFRRLEQRHGVVIQGVLECPRIDPVPSQWFSVPVVHETWIFDNPALVPFVSSWTSRRRVHL